MSRCHSIGFYNYNQNFYRDFINTSQETEDPGRRGPGSFVLPCFLRPVYESGEMMTRKQKRFIDEYMVDLNATQAAIRAGYSEKTAYSIGCELLRKPEIENEIKSRLDELQGEKIASAAEVVEYLSSVLRGESTGVELMNRFIGDGCSEPELVEKLPSTKDKLKAAELLGKRYGLFKDKLDVDGTVKTEMSQLQSIMEQIDSG